MIRNRIRLLLLLLIIIINLTIVSKTHSQILKLIKKKNIIIYESIEGNNQRVEFIKNKIIYYDDKNGFINVLNQNYEVETKIKFKKDITYDIVEIGGNYYLSECGKMSMIKQFDKNGKLIKTWRIFNKKQKRPLKCAYKLEVDNKDRLYAITPKYIFIYDNEGKKIDKIVIKYFKGWISFSNFEISEKGKIYYYDSDNKELFIYNKDGIVKKILNLKEYVQGSIWYFQIRNNKIYYLDVKEKGEFKVFNFLKNKMKLIKIYENRYEKLPVKFYVNNKENKIFFWGVEAKKEWNKKKEKIKYYIEIYEYK